MIEFAQAVAHISWPGAIVMTAAILMLGGAVIAFIFSFFS